MTSHPCPGLAKRARRCALLSGIAAVLLSFTPKPLAQDSSSGSIDLFGEEIVRSLGAPGNMGAVIRRMSETAEKKRKDEGLKQTLNFTSGRQLRGQLVQVTPEQILWKHPEASEPLRFARGEVRKVQFGNPRAMSYPVQVFMPQQSGAANRTPSPNAKATVKLPGGDWLHGDVLSDDGQTLKVKISDKTSFEVKRSFVPWLYLGSTPGPAVTLSDTGLGLEGWSSDTGEAKLKWKDGVATVQGAAWIGKATAALRRFELRFEIAEDSENGTRIWLQPIGPYVNSYTTGTMVMTLGKEEFHHTIYANKMNETSVAVPKSSSRDGMVSYRVLYDGPGGKFSVLRNGQKLGEWKFFDDKDADALANRRETFVNGFCLDRSMNGQETLKMRKLEILPWDAQANEPAAKAGDCLVSGDDLPRTIGDLGALEGTDFVLSGEKKPRKAGTFLQFPNQPAPLASADSLLSFGMKGELAVSKIVIGEDGLQCETVFNPNLKVPLDSVQEITFPAPKEDVDLGKADVLVFRNGDELPGQLVSVKGENLRWRTVAGQEVDFRNTRVAGVKLVNPKGMPDLPTDLAAVELRNGDRLQGKLLALDNEKAILRNDSLGEISLKRNDLFELRPSATTAGKDGGFLPEAWIAGGAAEQNPRGVKRSGPPQWAYIDGTYILRGRPAQRYSSNESGLLVPVPEGVKQYEVRFDCTDVSGNEPNCSLYFSNDTGSTSMQVTYSYGRLQSYVFSRTRMNGPNWKTTAYAGKVPEIFTRQRVRVFIDMNGGSADFYLNGYFLARLAMSKEDKKVEFARKLRIGVYGQGEAPVLLSNLWIGPWNGDLPKPGETGAGVSLVNGDLASGEPGGLKDDQIEVTTELGPFQIPAKKIAGISFGGERLSAQPAGRLRLLDDSLVSLDEMTFENGRLVAKSPSLGPVEMNTKNISELVFRPSPILPPQISNPSNVAAQPGANKEKAE